MRIKNLPQMLALHLKRFKYVDQLCRHTKLSYRVLFPFELRLFNVVIPILLWYVYANYMFGRKRRFINWSSECSRLILFSIAENPQIFVEVFLLFLEWRCVKCRPLIWFVCCSCSLWLHSKSWALYYCCKVSCVLVAFRWWYRRCKSKNIILDPHYQEYFWITLICKEVFQIRCFEKWRGKRFGYFKT